MFIRHVLYTYCIVYANNFKRSPTTFFPHSNAMSVYAEARVISLLYKWSRYRCMSDPVDVTNGIFTAVENERGKDHSVNWHLYLEVETRKLEHFPGMPGSRKKASFTARRTLQAPCLLLQWNLKHKGADLQGDTKNLAHVNIHTHDSPAYFTEGLISECKHVLNHTHTVTFRRNGCVWFLYWKCAWHQAEVKPAQMKNTWFPEEQ